jgi:hypothetical protein
MAGLYSETLELYNNLKTPVYPAKVFSDCVYDRLNKVFTVQADAFDDCLNKLMDSVNKDMTKDYNLKHVNSLFNNLYHYSGINRIRLLDILIDTELANHTYTYGGIQK